MASIVIEQPDASLCHDGSRSLIGQELPEGQDSENQKKTKQEKTIAAPFRHEKSPGAQRRLAFLG